MMELGLGTTPMLRVLALLISAVPRASAYTPWNLESDYFTSTLVGGNMGDLDGRQTNALFNRPDGLAIDEQAQELYIADRGNHRIRRVRIGHPDASDYVTTFVGWYQGFADGFGTNARFDEPIGLAVDGYTRLLFVADSANMVIRQVDLNTARVTTLAGSPGVQGFVNGRGGAAAFSMPAGLALALHSRQLFVCDPYNHAVRVVNVVTREVRTLAGSGIQGSADGRGEIASFELPHAVAVDADERTVYVAERSPRVRAIETAYEPASTTTVSTGGGSPPPQQVRFNLTNGTGMSAPPPPPINRNPFSPRVSTLVDDSGPSSANLQEVSGIAYAYDWPGGGLVLADSRRNRLYIVSLTMSGSGLSRWALRRRLSQDVAEDDAQDGAPSPSQSVAEDDAPSPSEDVSDGGSGGLSSSSGRQLMHRLTTNATAARLFGTNATLGHLNPCDAFDFATWLNSGANGTNPVTVLAAALSAAQATNNTNMTRALANCTVYAPPPPPYVSPYERAVSAATRVCAHGMDAPEGETCHPTLRLLAGSTPGLMDGMNVNTRFYRPRGLALDPSTQLLYVADSYNHRVRLIDLTDVVVTGEGRPETDSERMVRAFRQNFAFIIMIIVGGLGFALCTFLCCRYFPLCPWAKERYHQEQLRKMRMGSRA